MRWVGGCLGCLLSCPSLALWLSFCKISSTFPWRSLCPCGFGSLSGLGWCVRGCQASHMLRRGVGLWFVFSLGFSLKHVSGAVLRPSLYDLLCQVPDWLCGRLVFVVGDRSVDRLDPHGAYIDRTCSICGPNTVALHFLGMHLHPYSQR